MGSSSQQASGIASVASVLYSFQTIKQLEVKIRDPKLYEARGWTVLLDVLLDMLLTFFPEL